MYKNNINTPVEYIFKMNGIYKGQIYCEFSSLMERLFFNATEEKFINSNEKEQNLIIKDTINIITNSYFKEKKELNFVYNQGTINYNFKEAANTYEKNMNQIKSK